MKLSVNWWGMFVMLSVSVMSLTVPKKQTAMCTFFLYFKTMCFQGIWNSFQMRAYTSEKGLESKERLIIWAQWSLSQHWWSILLSSYGNLSHALWTICPLCPDKYVSAHCRSWKRHTNNCMLIYKTIKHRIINFASNLWIHLLAVPL